MKRVTAALLMVVLLLSFGMPAYAAESASVDLNKGVTLEKDGVITPNAWYYSYTKTITKKYLYLEDIPESIDYSEYNKGMGVECSGVLYLQSVTILYNGYYKAEFSGTIGAYIF